MQAAHRHEWQILIVLLNNNNRTLRMVLYTIVHPKQMVSTFHRTFQEGALDPLLKDSDLLLYRRACMRTCHPAETIYMMLQALHSVPN